MSCAWDPTPNPIRNDGALGLRGVFPNAPKGDWAQAVALGMVIRIAPLLPEIGGSRHEGPGQRTHRADRISPHGPPLRFRAKPALARVGSWPLAPFAAGRMSLEQAPPTAV